MNNYIRRLGINELKTPGVVNKYDHRLSEDVNGIISSQFLNGLLTTFSPGYNQPGSRIHTALETDHHELAFRIVRIVPEIIYRFRLFLSRRIKTGIFPLPGIPPEKVVWYGKRFLPFGVFTLFQLKFLKDVLNGFL